MKTLKLSLLTLLKISMIAALALLFIGFRNIEHRSQAAEETHQQTYRSILKSDQYDKLPQEAVVGLENLESKFYFINKVNKTYSLLFSIFLTVASLAITVSIVFDFLRYLKLKKQ